MGYLRWIHWDITDIFTFGGFRGVGTSNSHPFFVGIFHEIPSGKLT